MFHGSFSSRVDYADVQNGDYLRIITAITRVRKKSLVQDLACLAG